MLMQIFYFLLLVALFILLGKSADFLIDGSRALGAKLKIKTIHLGFILGILTTTPELFIGINTVLENVQAISFGNLAGGIIILLGFIMGLNIVLRKNIEIADGVEPPLLLFVAFLLIMPLIFILDGKINSLEGVILILTYIAIVIYWFKRRSGGRNTKIQKDSKTQWAVVYFIIGIIGIVFLSRFIVDVTLALLEGLRISKLMIGVIVFSIGTNLPEIIVVFESWRKKIKTLALGNLIGSAMANILVIGALAVFSPINVVINESFIVFFITFIVVVGLFVFFSYTKKKLQLWEGATLILIYLFFVLFEFLLIGVV